VVIDIISLIILVLSVYKGWTKGFIMSVFVFISYLVSLALALHFSGTVEGYIRTQAGTDSKWYPLLSFILVLLAGIIAVRLLGKLIEKSAEVLLLGFFNRLMGIVLFALIYFTFYAVTLVYLERFDVITANSPANSKSLDHLLRYGKWVVEVFSEWLPALKNLFNDAKDIIKQKTTANTL
jgi:membrane protein required for colicin V production